MEGRPGSAALTSSTYRGSSVTLPNNTIASDLTPHHASVCDSASSTIGGAGPCGPLPASPFQWDVDGSHTHALVSPVMLNGKKKGGILSGLKKMFHHSKAGDSERASTGAGQRGADLSVTSIDGTTCKLEPSVSGSGKIERSVKSPSALRVQVGSSRDLTLAALLTSPVRASGAPGSPAVLNSPMPSMRLEHTSSAANLNLAIADGEVIYTSTAEQQQLQQQQRLFPSMTAVRAAGSGRGPSGPAISHLQTSAFATSVSSQLPGVKPWSSAQVQQQQQQQQQYQGQPLPQHGSGNSGGGVASLLHKSYSNVLPNPLLSAASSNSLSLCLQRGDSQGEDFRSSGSGTSGRVALPQITSPRTPGQDSSHHSVNGCGSGGVSPSCGAARNGGGGGGGTPPTPPAAEADPAMFVMCDGEEEDDAPGSVLLGMNPAVPQAMRRRKWALEDYQVVKRMYKGATSAVYRATCLRSGITVALKVYFLSKVPINVVHMIRREIELHVPMVHRNIVMLYAAFQDEKHIVLVEEFASRGDLFGIHRSMNCRLTETQTSELILAPFLDALAYLHARGIMHRDIKPENILFTSDWTLKIADFGVSINVHDERAVTRTGTADYMAPEVERCPLKHAPEDNKNNPNLAYTPAIDIWSVGVLAYEMLVGFPPFVSNGSTDECGAGAGSGAGGAARPGMAAFMAEQATRKTLRFPASVSAAAKDFIMATLNENPGDRPTAQQLLKHPWLFKAARRMSNTATASRLSNANLVVAQY